MAGAQIQIMSPSYNHDLDIFMPITTEDVEKALEKHSDIDAIYLTSPTYEGLCSNYRTLRARFPSRLIIVDEAHGAHFYFHPSMPPAAMSCGIDVVTNSVHKSLGGLNATALIHVGKQSLLKPQMIKDSYHLLNTTSPSPMILADTESCVAAMVNRGEEMLGGSIRKVKHFKERT